MREQDMNGWRKSSDSGTENACVELKLPSESSESVSVRDTKDRDGGTLTFSARQFAAFLDAIK
jgi:hypothetical protein